MRKLLGLALVGSALLASCGSAPPPPAYDASPLSSADEAISTGLGDRDSGAAASTSSSNGGAIGGALAKNEYPRFVQFFRQASPYIEVCVAVWHAVERRAARAGRDLGLQKGGRRPAMRWFGGTKGAESAPPPPTLYTPQQGHRGRTFVIVIPGEVSELFLRLATLVTAAAAAAALDGVDVFVRSLGVRAVVWMLHRLSLSIFYTHGTQHTTKRL